MTIGAIVINSTLTIFILVIGIMVACYFYDTSYTGTALSVFIAMFLCFAIWGVSAWYYGNTEEGKRAIKTQESNLGGGITREVKVYDVEGDIIATYKGKFDIEYDNDRILFDDENGNRHIIYYPTGNVIVDEVTE